MKAKSEGRHGGRNRKGGPVQDGEGRRLEAECDQGFLYQRLEVQRQVNLKMSTNRLHDRDVLILGEKSVAQGAVALVFFVK